MIRSHPGDKGMAMPWPEKRGNKWRVRWDSGRLHPETGKKMYDGQSGFDTETEAYNYGLDRESDVRNDRYIAKRDGSVLMKDYAKDWLDGIDVGHLREKACRSISRLYIVPRWGETAVGDIKPSGYRAWKKELLARPNVGADYGREILGLFAMMMDDAVEDELRKASPVSHKRRRGKYTKKTREQKAEMRIEDVHQLALNALLYWGFTGYVFIWTMVTTGMRPGELYGLRREYSHPNWPATDPDRERRARSVKRYAGDRPMPALRVEYQHQWHDGALALVPPKYESYRNLVVPPFLAELLEMLLEFHDSEWVFPGIRGGPVRTSNPSFVYWRKIADGRAPIVRPPRRHGGWLPRPTWPSVPAYAGKRLYLLRHGHKEWLDEDGIQRVAVEGRMGHELPGVEGVYSNVTTAMERSIMVALQARWVSLMRTLGPDFRFPSPTSLPVDLESWMKAQIKAAESSPVQRGS